jgi:DNA topoisomerase-1
MQVLQDRNYVRLDKKRFIPEDLGRIVTAFLEKFFSTYVQYDFTAALEEKLDDITNGSIAWKNVMHDFWASFSKAVEETTDLKVSEVIDALDEALGPHFFPVRGDGIDPRKCTQCADGRMGLKLGKFGAFIGCSNYPTCKNTAALTAHTTETSETDTNSFVGPRDLGVDLSTNLPVSVKMGPYGPYAQLGPAAEQHVTAHEEEASAKGPKKKKKAPADKPKRVSLPKGIDPNTIDLNTAIKLLSLPREVGKHPETGEMIMATIGRYGPYLQMGALSRSLPDTDDLLTIGLNRAVVLFAEPSKAHKRPSASAKSLGEHPKDGKPITLNSGRFGPYVKWGRTMATVTKAYDPGALTLEQAIELIETKLSKTAVPKAKASKKPKGSTKSGTETKEKTVPKPKASKTKASKGS